MQVTKKYKNHIFLVGPLPPPVHGMALVTSMVRDNLSRIGALTTTINLAADSLNRAPYARLSRIRKIFLGFLTLSWGAIQHQRSVMYLAVSGGWGQIYDLLFVILSRLLGQEIYLHHHNIEYITRHRLLTQLLVIAAGSRATHILASENLGHMLRRLYPVVARTYPLSAVIAAEPALNLMNKERSDLKTIGFISNISQDKGIFEFLELAEILKHRDFKLSILIAGPFQGAAVEAEVLSRLKWLPSAKYMGPAYGNSKIDFFNSIDLLLFPARKEYEGIIIYEAMSFGVPIIAWDSGCISEFVDSKVGHLVDANVDFKDEAYDSILKWYLAPEKLRETSLAALSRFAERREQNIKRLDELCSELVNRNFRQPKIDLVK